MAFRPTKALLESCESPLSAARAGGDPLASFYDDSPTVQYARVEVDRVLRFARMCMGS
jgi:hypothetical protein